jgi:glycosyltransferase involved in cell wall biosynthesis
VARLSTPQPWALKDILPWRASGKVGKLANGFERFMNSTLISCIIPVYNGEKYLGEAIESILRQSYRPIEIIIADDGSTDGTASIAAGYGKRVRYLRQPNAGTAAARNLGTSAAEGEFVAFLDADDVWPSDKLDRQIERFRARPELDICIAHVQNFWIPELIEEEKQFRDHRISKALPGYVTGTLLARRDCFNSVGHFNTAIAHADDTEWFLRASERGTAMELLPDVLLYRRLHYTNLSRVKASNSRDQYLQILKTALDRRRLNNT